MRRAKISDNLLDIYLMEKTEISRKNFRSTIVYSVRLINVSRYWRRIPMSTTENWVVLLLTKNEKKGYTEGETQC